jgi:hypothetical protein
VIFRTRLFTPPSRGHQDPFKLSKHLALPSEAHLENVGPEWLLTILNRYDAHVGANFLMLIWRCWMVRNGVLQAGKEISIAGSVLFLTKYVAALFQIRQRDAPADIRGKQKLFLEKPPLRGVGLDLP